MFSSKICPEGAVGPLDKSKELRSSAHIGARETASNTNIGQPSAVEIPSSVIPRKCASPSTFHRFGDLPPEIRCIIWELALPARGVVAYASKPAPRFKCSSRRRCKPCEVCIYVPPVRAPAVMQACREARYETQKVLRPLCTWLAESDPPSQLVASWSRAQVDEYFDNVEYRDEMVPVITWFNVRTEFIQFEPHFLHRFSEVLGPPNRNDVFQAALDPEIPLTLHSYCFDSWAHPADAFICLRNGIQALYHRYLRTRKHINICVGGMEPYLLTEEGWQKAIHEGLFSGNSVETRMILATDEALIRKYEALRHHCHQHIKPSRRYNTDQMLWSGGPNSWHHRNTFKFKKLTDEDYSRWLSNRLFASRKNASDAQLFMLQIADFIMWDMGLGYGRGEEIMGLDGRLKECHPLVQKHELRLPDATPVLIFAAIKPPEELDCSVLLNRLPQMRPKIPEEDSSRARLAVRRWSNNILKRLGTSL